MKSKYEDKFIDLMDFSITEITTRLQKYYDPTLPPEYPYPIFLDDKRPEIKPQKAAVLIPFLRNEGNWHILLIRRTLKSEDRHSGQVAFPGGRFEKSDKDPIQAAFREMSEETGIDSNVIKYLGRLQDMLTVTRYQIAPIVGLIPWPSSLVPQPEEVSRIFTIPFQWLADPTNLEVRQREHPETGDKFPVLYFKPYCGEVLWGASARITLMLLEALGLANPENRYRH